MKGNVATESERSPRMDSTESITISALIRVARSRCNDNSNVRSLHRKSDIRRNAEVRN